MFPVKRESLVSINDQLVILKSACMVLSQCNVHCQCGCVVDFVASAIATRL